MTETRERERRMQMHSREQHPCRIHFALNNTMIFKYAVLKCPTTNNLSSFVAVQKLYICTKWTKVLGHPLPMNGYNHFQ